MRLVLMTICIRFELSSVLGLAPSGSREHRIRPQHEQLPGPGVAACARAGDCLRRARAAGACPPAPRAGGSCSAQVARVGTRRLRAFPRSRALRSLYKLPARPTYRIPRSTLSANAHFHSLHTNVQHVLRDRVFTRRRRPAASLAHLSISQSYEADA